MAFIFPLPGRSRTLCDRFICKFLGVSWTKAAAYAQPEGVTRWIFFDPFLSFDPTTLEPVLLPAPKPQPRAQKMVSTTVLFRDHDRNGSPTQAVVEDFFSPRLGPPSELPGWRNLTQIVRLSVTPSP
jgi:hypothetical protein